MAQAHRTADHSLWFNQANFQESPGEGLLNVLTALSAGQEIALLLGGAQTRWARFAGGQFALRAADAATRQAWDAIAPGTWVAVSLVLAGATPAPLVGQGAAAEEAQAPPTASPVLSLQPAPQGEADERPGRLFDTYLFIDWSATNGRATAPAADQVWLCEMAAGAAPAEQWFPGRRECVAHVEARLLQHVAAGRRVLVGFDFAYGYPRGFADAAGLPTPSGKWLAVWAALSALLRDEENRSNRFDVASALNAMITTAGAPPGPFWNTPTPGAVLTATSPAFPFVARNGVTLSAWRATEERLRQAGMQPQSAFKLFTRGSVGSQALTGIPVVHHLRRHPLLAGVSLVWPFEIGFTAELAPGRRPFVLHAEIWPGVVQQMAEQLIAADPLLIKDQAQVRAMCLWADGHDATGTLAPFFSAPADLSWSAVERCICEEGWVLGTV